LLLWVAVAVMKVVLVLLWESGALGEWRAGDLVEATGKKDQKQNCFS